MSVSKRVLLPFSTSKPPYIPAEPAGQPGSQGPSTPRRRPVPLPEPHAAALARLVRLAQSDTGQSRVVANFLLAWWNAGENGGFDITDLWSLDSEIAQDVCAIFRLISIVRISIMALGYEDEINRIWETWRGKNGGAE